MLRQALHVLLVTGLMLAAGCGKEEEKKVSKPVPPPPPDEAVQPAPLKPAGPELTAADDRDDANYAALFPPSKKVEGWVKTGPVRGRDGSELAAVLPTLAPYLAPYRPELVAEATYERAHEGKKETVRAVLVRAPTTEDAYGMLSVSCPGRDVMKLTDVTRQVAPEEVYLVRGAFFGIFTGSTEGLDKRHLIEGLELLAGKTMFELAGRGGAPVLIQLFQSEDLPTARTFFLRDLSSLGGPAGGELLSQLNLNDVKAMNELLDLGKNVEFAVAAFDVKDWPTPDVIWVAKYPTPEKARQVYQAYKKVLGEGQTGDKLHDNTLLVFPKGRYLMGCWTQDAESVARTPSGRRVMPKIQHLLP